MIRWKVDRGLVKYKGVVYNAGDLLPVNFTEREKHRQVYGRRLVPVEITGGPSAPSTPVILAPVVDEEVDTIQSATIVPQIEEDLLKEAALIAAQLEDVIQEKAQEEAEKTVSPITIPGTNNKPFIKAPINKK